MQGSNTFPTLGESPTKRRHDIYTRDMIYAKNDDDDTGKICTWAWAITTSSNGYGRIWHSAKTKELAIEQILQKYTKLVSDCNKNKSILFGGDLSHEFGIKFIGSLTHLCTVADLMMDLSLEPVQETMQDLGSGIITALGYPALGYQY
jgi:hypothetical protein